MERARLREILDDVFREELYQALAARFGVAMMPDLATDDLFRGGVFSGDGYGDEQRRFIEGFAAGYFRSYLMAVRLAASARALVEGVHEGDDAGTDV